MKLDCEGSLQPSRCAMMCLDILLLSIQDLRRSFCGKPTVAGLAETALMALGSGEASTYLNPAPSDNTCALSLAEQGFYDYFWD